MTEIDVQVDLFHPADRVWHALTDRALLARWSTEVEPMAGSRDRLLLFTAGLPGFDAAVDAEVTDRREPELIALRCLEGGRRSRLTCALAPTAEGCRLSLREVLEHGAWPDEQRAGREESYRQALTGRLPAILDWLAFRQVDLRRGEVGTTAEMPRAEGIDDEPEPVRRRRWPLLVAGVAGVVLVAGAAGWAVLPAAPEPVAAPGPAPSPTVTATPSRTPPPTPSARPTRSATPTPSRPSRTPSATPSATPSRTPSSVPPSAPALTARYETVSTRLLGYSGEVVVDNPGGATVNGWKVVVTLAEGGTLTDVSGADWRQQGQVVTFTGPSVPAGRSRTFTFAVRDVDPLTRAPEDCALGDAPCAGL
ncbi:SRPBCC domain-containing protein [Micromonospora sp. C31]|uniref:SRPBCC family protein n=1 Tax=Micromonospora sp. C31 TaxID=2824876 RepID=UPI001B372B4C|nr:SRPBCC domain-containing protein [Micromonospora sp. C31]MBQ1074250.1 SRPBCC domain-containing protein [Micromonospora sp. C31]